jgi:hypothetical protein
MAIRSQQYHQKETDEDNRNGREVGYALVDDTA